MERLLLALIVVAFLVICAHTFQPDSSLPPSPDAVAPASRSPAAPASRAQPDTMAAALLEEVLDVHLRRVRGGSSLEPLTAAEAPRVEAFLASLKLAVAPGSIQAGATSRDIAQMVIARLSPQEVAALPGFLSAMLALWRGTEVAVDRPRGSDLMVNGVMADPAQSMTVAFKPGDRIETTGPIPVALKIGKAWVEIRAPTRMSIRENDVWLESGQVLVRVGVESSPETPAFTMQTPHSRMVDIGTVFMATVNAASSKVEVMAGIVRLKSSKTGGWMDIRAGEVGWTEADGEVAKRLATDPESASSRTGGRGAGEGGGGSTAPSGGLPGADAARGDAGGEGAGGDGGDGGADPAAGGADPAASGTGARTQPAEGQNGFPVFGGGGGFATPPLPTPTPQPVDTL